MSKEGKGISKNIGKKNKSRECEDISIIVIEVWKNVHDRVERIRKI